MQIEDEILRRYRDSFEVAQRTDKFGSLSKIAGIASTGVIAFIGLLLTFIVVGSQRDFGIAFVVFLIALVIGAVVGAAFYCIGVVLSALAKILIANLELSVCTSSTINEEQKENVLKMFI